MSREYSFYIYILSNKKNGTLYVGVTNNLEHRVLQHKSGIYEGFTKSYGLNRLIYYEHYGDINTAIRREKQIKAGSRIKKVLLIEKENPEWNDLFDEYIRTRFQ